MKGTETKIVSIERNDSKLTDIYAQHLEVRTIFDEWTTMSSEFVGKLPSFLKPLFTWVLGVTATRPHWEGKGHLIKAQKLTKLNSDTMVVMSDPQLKILHIIYRSPDGVVLQTTDNIEYAHHLGHIFSMDWATYSDVLFVGVRGGTCLFRFQDGKVTQQEFFAHPRGFDVDIVSVAPNGRMFATLSQNEDAIYIWDAFTRCSSKLHCTLGMGIGAQSNLSFSPNGEAFVFTTSLNEVIIVDTNSWKPISCGVFGTSIVASCWTADMYWLFSLEGSCNISYIHLESVNGEVSVTDVLQSPIEIDIEELLRTISIKVNLKDVYSIRSIVTDTSGKRLFVNFNFNKHGSDDSDIASCVAVFSLTLEPVMVLELLSPSPFVGAAHSRPLSMSFLPENKINKKSPNTLCVLWEIAKDGNKKRYHVSFEDVLYY